MESFFDIIGGLLFCVAPFIIIPLYIIALIFGWSFRFSMLKITIAVYIVLITIKLLIHIIKERE